MSTQEILLEEIKHQPEPVLREVWHYLKFLTRQRAEEQWADLLPTREVEQEVLDILVNMARVKVEIRPDPERLRGTNQVMDVRGSIEKVKAATGWSPEIPLEKTLRDLLNWHRQQRLATSKQY